MKSKRKFTMRMGMSIKMMMNIMSSLMRFNQMKLIMKFMRESRRKMNIRRIKMEVNIIYKKRI